VRDKKQNFQFNLYPEWKQEIIDDPQSIYKELKIEPSEEAFNSKTSAKIVIKPPTLKGDGCISGKYLIVARSIITNDGTFELCQENIELNINLLTIHAPTSDLIVYYLNETNYLFVEQATLQVNGLYDNEMTLEFSKNVGEPGDAVDLKVNADPGSTASICVIDQSVALMREPNELEDKMLKEQVNRMKLWSYYPSSAGLLRWRWNNPFERPDAQVKLNNAGLIVFSDLETFKLKKTSYRYHYLEKSGSMEFDRPMFAMAADNFRGNVPEIM
jgi:hypothetical protein